ncbi:MAG: hypothetical protein QM503_12735 [Bacteroidota bacterium]
MHTNNFIKTLKKFPSKIMIIINVCGIILLYKKFNFPTISILTILLVILIFPRCSSRIETPITSEDSTVIYPALNAKGIVAKITFFRKISKETGKKIGEGTTFIIKEKRYLRTMVNIENRNANNSHELVFHLDWLGENGKSFHRKQINLLPNDTTTILKSSISISPDLRQSGNYTLKVYLHRELIAEKKFALLPEEIITPLKGDEIKAQITLYRKKSKKSGKLIGEGSVFKIKKNRNIRAIIDINNRFGYGDRELKFSIKWNNENGETIYRKRINLPSTDSTSTLVSSISYGTKQPGKYSIQVLLFNKLIGEEKFEIRL